MISADFGDLLTISPFSYNNRFNYNLIKGLGMVYPADAQELPVIMKSGRHTGDEIMYSEAEQFQGRTLTSLKLKEILDKAPVVLRVKVGDKMYLAGKGFLATQEQGSVNVLLIAMLKKTEQFMAENIKIVLNKEIYQHSKAVATVEQIISTHPGDVLITNDIFRFTGQRLVIPNFRTIRERQQYIRGLLVKCLDRIRGEYFERRPAVAGPVQGS